MAMSGLEWGFLFGEGNTYGAKQLQVCLHIAVQTRLLVRKRFPVHFKEAEYAGIWPNYAHGESLTKSLLHY